VKGFDVCVVDPTLHTLLYGTLIGGNAYDMLLDVGHDADNVYITGETRSTNNMTADVDPLRYFQPLNPNVSTRDAVVLAIRGGSAAPEMVWRTAYGGVASERGWGIAGSTAQPSDIYLVGAAASQQFQAFPLHEFSTSSPLDYYQPLNLSGMGADFPLASWYNFEWGLDIENGILGFASPEASHQGHDGFIASFAAYHPVGVEETNLPGTGDGLIITPLPGTEAWTVHCPHAGNWILEVYDGLGRHVRSMQGHGNSIELDLSGVAPGIYLLRASDQVGAILGAKVLRP
jgi:hypothetical protein